MCHGISSCVRIINAIVVSIFGIVVTVSIHILNSLCLNLLQMDEGAEHKKAALDEISCSYGTCAMPNEKVNLYNDICSGCFP